MYIIYIIFFFLYHLFPPTCISSFSPPVSPFYSSCILSLSSSFITFFLLLSPFSSYIIFFLLYHIFLLYHFLPPTSISSFSSSITFSLLFFLFLYHLFPTPISCFLLLYRLFLPLNLFPPPTCI